MIFFGHLGTGALIGLLRASGCSRLDERFLLAGAAGPDLLDKPLGEIFFRDTFQSGRSLGHSLLAASLLAAAGWRDHRRRGRGELLSLGIGWCSHLLLDRMGDRPAVLFWPLLGRFRPPEPQGNICARMAVYITDYSLAGGELLGLAALLALARRRGVTDATSARRFILEPSAYARASGGDPARM
ncbi:MAG: metal-dependent hydrolase [Candidatus Geothermincolia bacterium]